MRFLSSSALAKAPKLRLAASCSAAETICLSLGPIPRVPRGLTPTWDRRTIHASAPSALGVPTAAADYSSAAAFGLAVLAFLAADFLRLASSAGKTFFSIRTIDPPALSTAALAPALA